METHAHQGRPSSPVRGALRTPWRASTASCWAAAGLLAVLAFAGCRDDFAAPTQGFIAVRTGDAFDVQVMLDDASAGFDPGVLGPLEAGTYRVRVERDCYRVDVPERVVTVAPAETVRVDFALTLAEFGTVRVAATDELTGDEVQGASVFRETAPGVFTAIAQTTPALVDSVPCGTARFRVEKAGFEPSAVVEAFVDTGQESQASASLGPVRATLIEMFTYALCPNCPYAADTIHVVIDDFPGEVYAIEWHSGASTPFFVLYDPQWKARELYYTGGATVGYPATAVAGGSPLLVGGNEDLGDYRPISRSILDACSNECPITMRLDGTIGSGSAELTARVKWRGGALPGNLKLRIALIENDVLAPGNEPDGFDFVSRVVEERPVVPTTPGEVLVFTASLPIVDWPPAGTSGDFQAVAWIQSDDTREILQVSGI